MAGFCRECSIDLFGEDFGDLAGLTTPDAAMRREYCAALCETCGLIAVDEHGARVGVVRDYPEAGK